MVNNEEEVSQKSIFNSRKFRLAILVIILCISIGFLPLISPVLTDSVATVISALVAIYGVYVTGNEVSKMKLGNK